MVVMGLAAMAGTAVTAGTVTIMVGVDGDGAQASESTLARVTAITDTDIIPTTDIIPDTDIIRTIDTTDTDITTDTTGTGTIVIIGITGGTTVIGTTGMAMGDIISERVTTRVGRSCTAARAVYNARLRLAASSGSMPDRGSKGVKHEIVGLFERSCPCCPCDVRAL